MRKGAPVIAQVPSSATGTVSVTPSPVEVCGLDGSTAFTITLDDQFLGTAALSDNGTAPAGSSGSFSPNPVTHPTKDSVYTLTGLQNVASGVYDIDFTATDNADPLNTADGRATMSLFAGSPGAAATSVPANGATGVALQPTLSWSAASDVAYYELQVSTAADFSSIVYSTTTTATSQALPTALTANTTYFWRVLETQDDYFEYYRSYHAFWRLYGIGLPDDVLRKVYAENALKLNPRMPRQLFR